MPWEGLYGMGNEDLENNTKFLDRMKIVFYSSVR